MIDSVLKVFRVNNEDSRMVALAIVLVLDADDSLLAETRMIRVLK
jgi:hypothetical protein